MTSPHSLPLLEDSFIQTHRRLLRSLVRNGEINIQPAKWIWLLNNYERDEIRQFIDTAITLFKIPAPLASLTSWEAKEAFDQLRGFYALDIVRQAEADSFFWRRSNHESRRNELYEPRSWTFVASSNVGGAASNYFHQKARFRAGHADFMSPQNIWADRNQRLITFNALFSLKMEKVDTTSLRSAITLHQYTASQFRPVAAKAIYDYFRAERVLDFSCGWGDRLAGFCASTYGREYLGCDPNLELQRNYNKQIQLYGSEKKIVIKPNAAEDSTWPANHFDLVFTSPPYFRAEQYSRDSGQSWVRYGGDIKRWLNGFLLKALTHAYRAIKPSGFLAINIADRWISGDSLVVRPMNAHLESLGATFCDVWGLQMAKRPNSDAKAQEGIFVEPIWIWRKGKIAKLGANNKFMPLNLRGW